MTGELRVVVGPESSLVDGRRGWLDGLELRSERCVIDGGSSPAGNAGPYLKVPREWEAGPTRHRVYCRWGVGSIVRLGGLRCVVRRVGLLELVGGWIWVLEIESETRSSGRVP